MCVCERERVRAQVMVMPRLLQQRAKKFSNGEQEKCNFSFLCYFCSFAFLCVCFYIVPSFAPTTITTHTITIQGSRCEEEEEIPFQNRTRALTRPFSLTLLQLSNQLFRRPLSPALTHTPIFTHPHICENTLARAYANLSKVKQPTYPYFLYSAHLFPLLS